MRLTPRPHEFESAPPRRSDRSDRPSGFQPAAPSLSHPTLMRALGAARDDQAAAARGFDPSGTFMRSVRRAGFDREEVAMTIGSGRRTRRWDGCVIIRDRFLGIEVEMDPSGTIGIGVRRVG